MLCTCVRTVLGETLSSSPICVRDSPSIRPKSTSRSRLVSRPIASCSGVAAGPPAERYISALVSMSDGIRLSPRPAARTAATSVSAVSALSTQPRTPICTASRTRGTSSAAPVTTTMPMSGQVLQDLAAEAQPVVTGEVEVERDDVDVVALEQLPAVAGRPGGPDHGEVVLLPQPARQRVGEDLVVVDDRHPDCCRAHAYRPWCVILWCPFCCSAERVRACVLPVPACGFSPGARVGRSSRRRRSSARRPGAASGRRAW